MIHLPHNPPLPPAARPPPSPQIPTPPCPPTVALLILPFVHHTYRIRRENKWIECLPVPVGCSKRPWARRVATVISRGGNRSAPARKGLQGFYWKDGAKMVESWGRFPPFDFGSDFPVESPPPTTPPPSYNRTKLEEDGGKTV